jgi:hypothetical protein
MQYIIGYAGKFREAPLAGELGKLHTIAFFSEMGFDSRN